MKKFGCSVTGLCKTLCARECRRRKGWKCYELCPDFEAEPCPKLSRAPYCCNGCIERVGATITTIARLSWTTRQCIMKPLVTGRP